MIDLTIATAEPRLHMRLPALADSLPVIRQVLRALASSSAIDGRVLDDAELAVTEAAANVVEHAYGEQGGDIEVFAELRSEGVVLRVADSGAGIAPRDRSSADPEEIGFGLEIVETVADRSSIEERPGGGTEVVLEFDVEPPPSSLMSDDALERIVRRAVAVAAAQADMPTDRVVEGLLVAEITARTALREVSGDRVELSLERFPDGFKLSLGPLRSGGAERVVEASSVPMIGAVIERLTDEVSTEPSPHGEETERISLVFGS